MRFLHVFRRQQLIPLLMGVTLLTSSAVAQPLAGGGRPVGADWSRSPVYGQHGMAATAQPLASQVALDVLKAGGSAVDAAIAANAALGLMEPTGNGIGGDLFAIVWDPKRRELTGYNGSGRSPARRTLADMQAKIAQLKAAGKLPEDYQGIPSHGSLSVTVPGTVDGWFALHERYGKLSMPQVLAPAISYANEGFPVSPVIAYYLERNRLRFDGVAAMIEERDNAQKLYFPQNRAPGMGELFRNPDLGRTLETIAQQGRGAFYDGVLAKVMADYFARIGGDLRYEDFAQHRGEWVQPMGVDYHGYTLYELPPNGQGFAALMMLNILNQTDLRQWQRGSPEVFHLMVEAKRLAFAAMAKTFADPAFADIPTDDLLSEAFAKAQFAKIDAGKALPQLQIEAVLEGEGDTTYLTVADGDGMMVSLIQSNYRGMGSGLVADGLGFMFQDRGELFALDETHPNAYAPSKRPFHTIIPAFVMRDGEPFMSFGLMGGGMQPQGHVQILVNIADFGMNIQEAGDAARFLHDGGASPEGGTPGEYGTLFVEPGVSDATIEELIRRGHTVKRNNAGAMFGGYQAIARDPQSGVLSGATEMRKDGTVTAW